MHLTLVALVAPFVAFAAEPLQETEVSLRPLTLAETSGSSGTETVSFSPSMPTFRWAEGGGSRRGRGGETVWLDPKTGEPVDAPEDGEQASTDEGPSAEEIAALLGTDEGRSAEDAARIARALAGRPSATSEDGSARVASVRGELWFLREGSAPRVIAGAEDERIEYPRLSPDGAYASFVLDQDYHVVETSTGGEVFATTDGGPDQFNGILDWVYQEEIYGRGNFLGHSWSPSSKHSVFLALDESHVYEFTVVDHIEDGHFRVKPEITNYPKVGDPNPTPRVGVVSAETGERVWLDLGRYDGQEILIVRFDWTPAGDRALITVQDRIQTWAELLSVDPNTGENEVLIRESSEAWTERPDPPYWLPDGSFIWQSHRTGPTHLYHYAANGELLGAITSGDWNVTSIEHVEPPSAGSPGHVWFNSTKDGDINTNLYRVGFDGSGLVRLTPGDGTHRVTWNDARTMFIDSVSSLTNPGSVYLRDAEGKTLATLVERAEVPAAKETPMGTWELHRVAARDGLELDAALLKPADFDPSRSYAVWISTYSGPAAPSVANRWSSSSFFHFLAQNDVLVLQANVRSSTRRGPGATAALYRRVGLGEVDDMVDVVDWLVANPWADGERVGITGYSFGGTMTANCLMRTDKFALGIAGGGVYDWRMYDTIYTERYMRTPADNLEGYEATSVLAQAENLNGFLHMHHGVMDDNVHVQNMYQMAYALMNAGKTNWSMMAYPQTRHGNRGVLSWHARQLEWELIQEYLLAGR